VGRVVRAWFCGRGYGSRVVGARPGALPGAPRPPTRARAGAPRPGPGGAGAAGGCGVNGIDCKSAAENRAYISAHGQVSACCWVTGSEEETAFFARHGLAPERYNIRNRPLAEILADEPFASLYAAAWAEDSLATCRHKCGRMLRNKRNRL
ncbi:MAG: hypothetical protein AAFV49_18695, partial [Pseudomonadota bacterium]